MSRGDRRGALPPPILIPHSPYARKRNLPPADQHPPPPLARRRFSPHAPPACLGFSCSPKSPSPVRPTMPAAHQRKHAERREGGAALSSRPLTASAPPPTGIASASVRKLASPPPAFTRAAPWAWRDCSPPATVWSRPSHILWETLAPEGQPIRTRTWPRGYERAPSTPGRRRLERWSEASTRTRAWPRSYIRKSSGGGSDGVRDLEPKYTATGTAGARL
jgi:hypothetical protein